ncbi:3-phosphoshikimate 1-carboxyvinyltransferase [Ornithinibacillus sp. 179-J 7C1 HS]|uniref:3-phosphoshikimate 1-carboxyvinyltransferase n=1 Tax=Ornithinibacillus sp. 179-J 7C1 HS TaxID=3142384 RepID=UPI0039A078B2
METFRKHGSICIQGEIEVPGDKSISHRAVILGSIASGTTKVENFLDGEDCMRTVEAFRSMGVTIKKDKNTLLIYGNGIRGLREPLKPLYFGNSGTTARLMLGLLSGMPFSATVYGDESLTKRPMDRVLEPLKKMGASVLGRQNNCYLPLTISGGDLHGITHTMSINSAQVKSSILLAGLNASGLTKVIENNRTRNHTENMLRAFGANINVVDNEITMDTTSELHATDIYVPGDISSAAFLIAAAAIKPNSDLLIKNIGLNETRTGFLDILAKMGSRVDILNRRDIGGEEIGDVHITYHPLKAVTVEGDIIPRLIDEIPIIALIATQANGRTIIRNAEELRVKETDRIKAVVDVLSTLGAKIHGTEDGMIIEGVTPLSGGNVKSYSDHRIAMMTIIASLITQDDVRIDDVSSISISYPKFKDDLNSVISTN